MPQRAGRRLRHLSLSGREVITFGLPRRVWQDLYHYFMTVSWPRLFAAFASAFVAFNLLFGLFYRFVPDSVARLSPPGYWGDVFFSIETLATVGYGDMYPVNVYGHLIASLEIFIGLMSLALLTGMMFARFSRPRARFLFARYAVVRPIEGRYTLMLRAANARQNIVMEAQAQLRLIREEQTAEGYRIRRIHDLTLVRHQHPVFIFGWTLLHVIDERSPLAGQSAASLAREDAYLLLTLSGIDETTGQLLMARCTYQADELLWNHGFADILQTGPDGIDRFDYSKLDEVVPLDQKV